MLKVEVGPNNPILRKVCDSIKKDELKKYVTLGKEMIKFIKNPDNSGVGLAAPQIGTNKRIIVVSLVTGREEKEEETYPTIMMINPEILEFSKEEELGEEGCLSLPNFRIDVLRSKYIKVQFTDDKGKKKTLFLEGFPARVVQHEVDHLNGILIVDKH